MGRSVLRQVGEMVDGPEDVVDRDGVVAPLRRHVEAGEHDQPVDSELAVAVDQPPGRVGSWAR